MVSLDGKTFSMRDSRAGGDIEGWDDGTGVESVTETVLLFLLLARLCEAFVPFLDHPWSRDFLRRSDFMIRVSV